MSANPLVALANISDDLDLVEKCLIETLHSEIGLLDGASKHLVNAGGKRIRPSLTLISSKLSRSSDADSDVACSPVVAERRAQSCVNDAGFGSTAAILAKYPEHVVGAVAVELVHLGSLYHDDVIDGAEIRRSVTAANRKYGNTVAILTGDLMLAKACSLAAALGPEASELLSQAISCLVAGQIREVSDLGNVKRSEASYLASIEGKTAALLGCAASMGAVTVPVGRTGSLSNGSGDGAHAALFAFGQAFGMAFQIVDDVLDCVATSDELGKPAGNDLLESNFTLPIIYALEDGRHGQKLRDILSQPLDVDGRDEVLGLVADCDALDRARSQASGFASKALSHLQRLPDCEATGALRYATEQLLQRTR